MGLAASPILEIPGLVGGTVSDSVHAPVGAGPIVPTTASAMEDFSSFLRSRIPAALAEPVIDLLIILRAVAVAFVSGAQLVVLPGLVLAVVSAGMLVLRDGRRSDGDGALTRVGTSWRSVVDGG
ncbi:MAG: hypothetical protein OEX97_07125 [Acidimicrobiia bacterium]|nr:hypothetical protein [Acidimicrobiia bacterium]